MSLPNLEEYGFRLPEDETILKISRVGDFKLFRDRRALGIRAIVYDLKMDETDRQLLINQAKNLTQHENLWEWFNRSVRSKTIPRNRTMAHGAASNRVLSIELAQQFDEAGLSEQFKEKVRMLAKAKEISEDFMPSIQDIKLVVNKQRPRKYHYHLHDSWSQEKLMVSLNGANIVILTNSEEPLTIPQDQVILFSKYVEYRINPAPIEDLENSPEINLII